MLTTVLPGLKNHLKTRLIRYILPLKPPDASLTPLLTKNNPKYYLIIL